MLFLSSLPNNRINSLASSLGQSHVVYEKISDYFWYYSFHFPSAFCLVQAVRNRAISGVPGLIILFLIFLGHFVTLDDDLTGGWSNPDASKKVALLSVGELALKFVALLFGLWLVLS